MHDTRPPTDPPNEPTWRGARSRLTWALIVIAIGWTLMFALNIVGEMERVPRELLPEGTL